MNKYYFRIWTALSGLGWLLFLVFPAKAQSTIQVRGNDAAMSFPDYITFYVDVNSDDPIETVKLYYGTNGRSCQDGGSRQILEFEPDKDVELEWRWELKRSGALPHGAEVWWQWEIINASGETFLSEKGVFVVDDDRHEWQEIAAEGVIVQWYEGDLDFGNELFNIAINGLNRLEDEIGIRPPGDLRLIIYASAEEVQDAMIHTYEWAGGVALDEYNSTIIGINPSQIDWARDVIPHELVHLIMGTLTFNCRGVRTPTWLHEGVAELAEGGLSPGDFDKLEAALEGDALPSLKSLESGFSAKTDQAALAYIQSGYVVDYLIREYGKDKFSAVLDTMRGGEAIDNALELVYGMDTAGLDAAWRNSLGFGSDISDQNVSDESLPTFTPVPTLALWTPIIEPTVTERPSATPRPTSTSTEPPPSPTPTSWTDDSIPTPGPMENTSRPSNLMILIGLGIGGITLGIIVIFIMLKRFSRDSRG
jgi:hypothetical protein